VKTSDVLDEAVKVAERLDHCKGNMFEPPGGGAEEWTACCTMGAIEAITRGQTHSWMNVDRMTSAALKLVGEVVGYEYIDVPDWNDKETTTKQDVVDALKKAAIIARERRL
jgi:hypothetical protein